MQMTYEVQESTRARHLRVTVHPDGRVVVTKPRRMPAFLAHAFAEGKRAWIEEMRERMRAARERSERKYGAPIALPRLRRGTKAYRAVVAEARAKVAARLPALAAQGGFQYGTVSIRNQKTRWGSCAHARGGAPCNLSFNYRLVHLTPAQLDYLLVHELAHTRHHNHGDAFWTEVGKWIPAHEERRRELRRYQW